MDMLSIYFYNLLGGYGVLFFIPHITWSWPRTLVLLLLFSLVPGQLSTTTIVRLFSGGMVLLPAVSINTLRYMELFVVDFTDQCRCRV